MGGGRSSNDRHSSLLRLGYARFFYESRSKNRTRAYPSGATTLGCVTLGELSRIREGSTLLSPLRVWARETRGHVRFQPPPPCVSFVNDYFYRWWTQLCQILSESLGGRRPMYVSLSPCDSFKLHTLHARMFAVRQSGSVCTMRTSSRPRMWDDTS